MSDDLGYEVIGCNGGTSYQTPVLDGMAAGGARFENAHVQPLCTPTRVQLMTGKYNFRNYIGFGLIAPDVGVGIAADHVVGNESGGGFTFAQVSGPRWFAVGMIQHLLTGEQKNYRRAD